MKITRRITLLLTLLFIALAAAARETELRIPNGSGDIYGVLSKPENGEKKQPIVILSHGFNGTHHFGRAYFEALNGMGYQCFAFDFPCGSVRSRSDGNTMEMSIPDEQKALETIVDYFKAQPDVDRKRIVLLGESQGGLVSALAGAAKRKDVAGLVLVFPALCIPDNWRDRYPDAAAIPDTTHFWGVDMGRRFFAEIHDMDVFPLIGKFRKPVVIIQGDKDFIVSLDDSRHATALYKDATLHVIPGAGHGFRPQEFETSLRYIREFLTKKIDRQTAPGPIDTGATPMTRALFRNLKRISGKHVLFGHQDATAYGHAWRSGEGRSDVKDITGSHPAVIGTDFAGLSEGNDGRARRSMEELRKTIRDTYNRGGLVTVCWHANNPLTGGGFYADKKNPAHVMREILPGGKAHDTYKQWLDRIAEVAHSATDAQGRPIPFIFRPFHEFDGDWFWWGARFCTPEEFVGVWRYTVDYLRGAKQVHNILYAFSPDCRFDTEEKFLERYPGDDYVDMLGMDNYWDFRPDGANNPDLALRKLAIVSRLAEERGKLAALTETGLEGVTQADWFTHVLLPILKDKRIRISYVLVWRNAHDNPKHFYAPFPGHPAAEDFKMFHDDKLTWFENDLPGLYE